jgi:hypothetical protein
MNEKDSGLLDRPGATARKRYAVVGLGSRARMYTNAIVGKYRDGHEVVAVCDTNAGRMGLAVKKIAATGVRVRSRYGSMNWSPA